MDHIDKTAPTIKVLDWNDQVLVNDFKTKALD
jgi:hypothetical protein